MVESQVLVPIQLAAFILRQLLGLARVGRFVLPLRPVVVPLELELLGLAPRLLPLLKQLGMLH